MSSVAAGSKELLPVAGKPVLSWVLGEARRAGTERSIVVVSPEKPDLIQFVERQPGVEIAMQAVPNGLAPAVVLAAGLQPVLLMLPDTLLYPSSPSSRIVSALARGFDFAIAVQRIEDSQVSKYGIVEWDPNNGRISRILEKPRPDETTSRWAIAARLGISARTMLFVKTQVEVRGGPGEIDLPPLLGEAAAQGHAGLAIPLEPSEVRWDCGNPEGYRNACEVIGAGV